MPPAKLPPNETARLAALHDTLLLDSPRDRWFDNLVHQAARRFAMPTSVISLVDRERQWFKARFGSDMRETSREIAFCAHAILDTGPLVVEDACGDPRFADNPMVLGAPGIRFYAGAPLLVGDNLPIGVLCLIDYVPRTLTRYQIAELMQLGRRVSMKIAVRRMVRDLYDCYREPEPDPPIIIGSRAHAEPA